MAKGLWEKIESIRQEPEHIRMRYVLGCLTVSMVFIVGIWMLSLGESFRNISKDIPGAVNKSKEMLPKEQVPSLNDLLEKAAPLRSEQDDTSKGKDYFNEQFQKGATQ
ncbi:MAG: hypothetical protein WCG73_01310 [Candidatus Moraniibacteriota bacterium]